MNLIVLSIVASAGLRLIAMLACFEANVLLDPCQPNYPHGPRLFRWAMGFGGAVLAANVADLIYRAVSVVPPRPLLSGYFLTAFFVMAAVAGHRWLRATWLPAKVRAQQRHRLKLWRDLPPCVRRQKALRERARTTSAGAVAAGRSGLDAIYPPVTEGEDDVIPPSLRDA